MGLPDYNDNGFGGGTAFPKAQEPFWPTRAEAAAIGQHPAACAPATYPKLDVTEGRLPEPGRTKVYSFEELKAAQPEQAGPLATQVGGEHYKSLAIQPVQYIHANKIPFMEGNVIKYVSRWRSKGGIADLKKARHFIDLLIELEGGADGKR